MSGAELISVGRRDRAVSGSRQAVRPRAHVHAVDGVSLVAARERDGRAGRRERQRQDHARRSRSSSCAHCPPAPIRWRGEQLSELNAAQGSRLSGATCRSCSRTLMPRSIRARRSRRRCGGRCAARLVPKHASCRRRPTRLLELVGLRPASLYLDRYPHEFSGGQRQRIAIARALALQPELSWSPTSRSRRSMCRSARRSSSCCKTSKPNLQLSMLFLSHDLGVVRLVADRVAVMYLGKIVEIARGRRVVRARPASLYAGCF